MNGQVELRTASIWVEASPDLTPELRYWKKGDTKINYGKPTTFPDALRQGYNPVIFNIGGLDIQTTYEYQVVLQGDRKSPVKSDGQFTTKELWQFRKPAPDFSFITGSCSYMNQPPYDRPGKPYGGDSSIYESMAKENAAFMLWLGDNWYTREVD